jgi:hypothetical protein
MRGRAAWAATAAPQPFVGGGGESADGIDDGGGLYAQFNVPVAVSGPLFWRPFGLSFPYVPPVLVTKY